MHFDINKITCKQKDHRDLEEAKDSQLQKKKLERNENKDKGVKEVEAKTLEIEAAFTELAESELRLKSGQKLKVERKHGSVWLGASEAALGDSHAREEGDVEEIAVVRYEILEPIGYRVQFIDRDHKIRRDPKRYGDDFERMLIDIATEVSVR